jgi:zinc transporter ZupT
MAGESLESEPTGSSLGGLGWLGAALPIILLAVLIGGLVMVPPFAGVDTGAPLPDVTVTHATLPDDETVALHVVNNGPAAVTIEQVMVNDAYWAHTIGDGGPDAGTLGAMESATIRIPYHWTPGWDMGIGLVLSSGATIHHTIVAPNTPDLSNVFGTLALVGLFVGLIPILLGMLWYPFMRKLSDRMLHAVLALAGGILAFLAFDAGFEAFEVAHSIPGAYEGPLLVVLGIGGTLLLVQAVSEYFSDDGHLSPLGLGYLIALSIGLHNLAEGLAIGGAVALGRVSLGAFLVIGFMVHNVTEGPAVVAPLAREERPKLRHFGAMGLLAGAPVILGGWIGSLAVSPTLGAVFLAIGVGAILQVEWEMGSMIARQGRLATATNLVAFLIGLVVMYVTDLLVAL